MGKSLYYNYDGKKVGTLTKVLSDVVMIEQDWIDAMNNEFAENGYDRLFSGVAKSLRGRIGEQLTPAQLFILVHHITNQGVPQALRDKGEDEKSAPVKFIHGAVGMATSTVDSATNTVVGATTKVVDTTKSVGSRVKQPFTSSEDEEESGIPDSSPP